MALNRILKSITRRAGADLSALQHTIIKVAADGDVEGATNEVEPLLGVLQNKPANNEAAEIAINGSVVKCVASASIDEGDWITAAAGGKAEATTTDLDEVVGFALTSVANANELFELVVAPGTHSDS